jgi:NADP-dependent 3-hydroxy acid dehydrogenase YdfG
MTRRLMVIGATSGIAQETSRYFAAEHARLFLVGRDQAKLESVADDLTVRGAEAVRICVADLTDESIHPAIISSAVAEWDGLDAALIIHGTLPDQSECEHDPVALRNAMETNFMSVASLLGLLANAFEKQRSGVLAVVGSVAGDRGRRSNYVYGSAKAAIEVFVAGLRARLAPLGVRVILIKPGWVDTPMTAHLRKNFLYATANRIGCSIHALILSPRPVAYLPWYWRWIMLAIRQIPEPVFSKLNL